MEIGSTIVYDDKVDGFYDDIKDNDIDFRGQAELVLTGKVFDADKADLTSMSKNGKLYVSKMYQTTAIDVSGKVISGIKLDSKNILKSNLDNSSPSTLEILVTKDKDVNLKDVKFDGLTFKAKAVSANAATLNKNKHTIKIEDLKVCISSEISVDADSKKD